MLPTASSSDLPSASFRSRLSLIRDAVPDTPRQAGVNALIDAAAPIFSYLRTLRLSTEALPDVALLKKTLERKLKQVVEKMQHEVTCDDHLVLCHYALCATVDDILQQVCSAASSMHAAEWRKERFLLAFESTPETSTRFFAILEHLLESPESNLMLLELFYTCMALGYFGAYRRSLQHQEYQRLFDRLYKTIRMHREPISSPSTVPSLMVDAPSVSSIPWRFVTAAFGLSFIVWFILGYDCYDAIVHFTASF